MTTRGSQRPTDSGGWYQSAGGDDLQAALDPVESIMNTVEAQPDLGAKLRDFTLDMGKGTFDGA